MAEEIVFIVNDTQEEVTLFVDSGTAAGVDSFNTRTGVVVPLTGDYTAAQVTNAFDKSADTTDDITEGTAKFTTAADITKLAGIETGAEVNTINTDTTGEPTGSDLVLNVVSLTQAEYDAGTPVSTTFYIING